MKLRRMISVMLTLICIVSCLSICASAASAIPVAIADPYFGCADREYQKDGKTALEYHMPVLDTRAVNRYIDLLEEDYGLKLHDSYPIPSQGDYYYVLNYGNVNCVMLYWDKSYESMTVTIYDRVAYFVYGSAGTTLYVEGPKSFLGVKAEKEYDPADGCYSYYMTLGKNGLYDLAEYIMMLKQEYGLDMDKSESYEAGNTGVYLLVNEQNEPCVAIVTVTSGNETEVGFVFDGSLCVPVD